MKNANPILSICIPTYNRANFLKECLASLCESGCENLFEVVVSDNASTDNTLEVLRDFSDRLPIKWHVQSDNFGLDRNFNAVVNFACGEYCWILGSDDVVSPNSIFTVLHILNEHKSDILNFGYIQADIGLNKKHVVLPKGYPALSGSSSLKDYVSEMPNISLLFAFISSFVFKRSLWVSRQEKVLSWVGSSYIHMLTMHCALSDGAVLASIPEAIVVARGGNPNEFNSVPGKFIELDARTAERIINEIYGGDDEMWQAYQKPFKRSYPIRSVCGIAAYGGISYLSNNQDILCKLGYKKYIFSILRMLTKLKIMSVIGCSVRVLKKISQDK